VAPTASDKDHREDLIRWVATHIIPHEADVRRWLRKTLRSQSDADDVIQEAYCRLSELSDTSHIQSGRAYFFTIVRSIVIHGARREKVVAFDAIEDGELIDIQDEAPSPERVVDARLQLRRVLDAIAALPPAYRHVVEMRRIHGLSQKETARHLGITEKIVENNSLRGLRMIMKILSDGQPVATDPSHRDEPAIHAFH